MASSQLRRPPQQALVIQPDDRPDLENGCDRTPQRKSIELRSRNDSSNCIECKGTTQIDHQELRDRDHDYERISRDKKLKDARGFMILILGSNIVGQLTTIFSAINKTDPQMQYRSSVNQIYTLFLSIPTFVLLVISFRKNIEAIYHVVIISSIRLLFSIFDVQHYRDTVSITAFHLNLCYQTAYGVILGLVMNNIFRQYRLLLVAGFILAMQAGVIKSLYEIDTLEKFLTFYEKNGLEELTTAVSSFIMFFLSMFTLYYQIQKVQNELALKFKETTEQEFEIRTIMNSMNHGILILKCGVIHYVNSLFDQVFNVPEPDIPNADELHNEGELYPEEIERRVNEAMRESLKYNSKDRQASLRSSQFLLHSNKNQPLRNISCSCKKTSELPDLVLEQPYSMNELEKYPANYLKNCVFKVKAPEKPEEDGSRKSQQERFKLGNKKEAKDDVFIQISKQVYRMQEKVQTLFQFTNISKVILYDQMQAEQNFVSLINVTVSHELRGPLNSIIQQIVGQKYFLETLQANVKQLLSTLSQQAPFPRQSVAPGRHPPDTGNALKRKTQKQGYCNGDSSILQTISQEMKSTIDAMGNGLRIQDSSSKLMLYNVEDILDFGQLESGKFRKTLARFSIKDAIEEIIQVQQYKAVAQDIALSLKTEGFEEEYGGRPGSKAMYDVISDKQRIQQVVLNFINNALKFTDTQGTIDVYCKMYSVPPEQQQSGQVLESDGTTKHLHVSVKDSGCGISKENQTKLFKLFGMLTDTKEYNTKGIGLGLAISQKIVNQFGGQIAVESEWGEGAKFYFDIEVEVPPPKDDDDGDDQSQARSSQERGDAFQVMDGEIGGFLNNDVLSPSEIQFRDALQPKTFRNINSFVQPQNAIGTRARINSIQSKIDQEDDGQLDSLNSITENPQAYEHSSSFASESQQILEQELPIDKYILITDDDFYQREALSLILKIVGINVQQKVLKASNGLKAFNTFKEFSDNPDNIKNNRHIVLAFMDCNMPVMDGYSATSSILANCAENQREVTPTIIGLTGHTEYAFIEKGFNSGMTQVFSKPANAEKIKETLKAYKIM